LMHLLDAAILSVVAYSTCFCTTYTLSQLIYWTIPSLRPGQIALVQMDVALRDCVGSMPQHATHSFQIRSAHQIRAGGGVM